MKTKIILLIILLSGSVSEAQEDCPWGEVFCDGECGLFVDDDGDGICDCSQPPPGERNLSHDSSTPAEKVSGDTAGSAVGNNNANPLNSSKEGSGGAAGGLGGSGKGNKKAYNFSVISISLIILYILSLAVVRANYLSRSGHRKLWNVLLLISFMVCAISGILLVIRISHGVEILPHPGNLFWHVEFGIAMTVISVFHIIWHLDYFKKIIKF